MPPWRLNTETGKPSDSQGLGFGNINNSNTEVNSDANQTQDVFDELDDPAPHRVLRTNGSYAHLRIGATKLIKVMANDVVQVEAYAKNPDETDDGGVQPGITSTILGTAFGGVSGGSGTDGAIFDLFTTEFSAITTGLLSQGNPDVNKPKAYLNWILFDENFDVVNSGTGYDQVGTGSTIQYLQSPSITVQSSGYFYIYVSNESTSTIYFDDVRLEHTKGQILQEDHYYPFGMSISALSSSTPLSKPNNFKYNGFEEQTDFDLGWYDYQARYYDPQLGRFMQVDPAADLMRRQSPYNYAFNNPVRFIDPDGMMPDDKTESEQDLYRKQQQAETQGINAAHDNQFGFGANNMSSGLDHSGLTAYKEKLEQEKNKEQKQEQKQSELTPVDLGGPSPLTAILNNLELMKKQMAADPSKEFFLDDIINLYTNFPGRVGGSTVPRKEYKAQLGGKDVAFVFQWYTQVYRKYNEKGELISVDRFYAERNSDNQIAGAGWQGDLKGDTFKHTIYLRNRGTGARFIRFETYDDGLALYIMWKVGTLKNYNEMVARMKQMRSK